MKSRSPAISFSTCLRVRMAGFHGVIVFTETTHAGRRPSAARPKQSPGNERVDPDLLSTVLADKRP
jgi:hypothetical protein